MSAVDLQTPITDDGSISSINFFNGRLLTARDLSSEQQANRQADRRLGQAVGDGIAYGLEISSAPNPKNDAPVVRVKPGLAVNRNGQTLRLVSETDIALVRKANPGEATAKLFSECLSLQAGTYVAGAGVYLLTLAPAETRSGRAAASGLETGVASCNTDTVITAVQFRLLRLDPPLTGADLLDSNHLRSHLAHRCFGTTQTKAFAAQPFSGSAQKYGLLDELRDIPLTDCDVPLGVLYWTLADGINFLDMWSVRRRLISKAVYQPWEMAAGDRRLGEAEAAFLQFQDQLQAIVTNEKAILPGLTADERFEFLPAGGFLPVGPGQLNWETFLGPLATLQKIATDESLLRSILRQSFEREPISVGKFAESAKPGAQPPVPVDVFSIPGNDDFVLFARSARSRLRVFPTPPPKNNSGVIILAESSLTSMVIQAPPPNVAGSFEIVATESGEYTMDATVPGFFKPAPITVEAIAGRTVDIELALTPMPRGSILIMVKDDESKDFINDKVKSVTATDEEDFVSPGDRDADGNWLIADLIPGKYDIDVFATGYEAGAVNNVNVLAGGKLVLTVELTRVVSQRSQPDLCVVSVVTVNQVKPKVQLCMLANKVGFKQKPPKTMLKTTLDKAGTAWLAAWRDWLDGQYPKLNIDLTTPALWVDPQALIGNRRARIELGDPLAVAGKKAKKALAPKGAKESASVGILESLGLSFGKPPEALAFFGSVAVEVTISEPD